MERGRQLRRARALRDNAPFRVDFVERSGDVPGWEREPNCDFNIIGPSRLGPALVQHHFCKSSRA